MIRKSILNFFASSYDDSSYITRQKVSLLLWNHLILLPVMTLYLFINIFRNNPREWAGIVAIDLIMIITLSAGLYLVKKGKFKRAVVLDLIVMMFLAIAGYYVKRYIQIDTGFNNFTAYIFGVMVFTSLFSSRLMQIIISALFLSITCSFYFYSLTLASPSVHIYLLSGTLNTVIVILFILNLLYNNSNITDKALEMAQHEIEVNAELNRSLEQKVHERTETLAEERESLHIKNQELEDIRNTLTQKNMELKTAWKNAEYANKAKNRFLATLSHELRTPLNGIIGVSDLMLEKEPCEENIKTLQMIKQSGKNLFFIIQDLLDFTTIENNQISIQNSFFSIDVLVDHIIMDLEDQIRTKNLKFTKTITPDKAVIYSDQTRIAQIIINLITNSLKYTRTGSIDLSIIISDIITIRISDTGIGIEKNKIDSIFQAFIRVEDDYVKSQTGLGLGLSVVSQIITMMNGVIHVDSEEGKGSVFTVEIPLEEATKQESEIESARPRDYSIINGKKILIVEDDGINRFYFKTILKKAGAEVSEALNGKEALCLTDITRYNLILMDLNMPDFDGMMLTRIIRNSENPNKDTIISALSAHAYKDHIDMCLDAGMNDFISKPVEREPFLNTICTLLMQDDIGN